MLYVFIPKDFDLITKIQEGIAKDEGASGSIRTWSYDKLRKRYTWNNNNQANWPNLEKRAYFTIVYKINKDGEKYAEFTLHAKQGIKLTQEEYSQMHSAMLYMIMAHFGRKIDDAAVSKVPVNNTDVQD